MPSTTVEFEFAPGQFVNVCLFGRGYQGRIVRCIYDGVPTYSVDYYDYGDETIKYREFHEDELVATGEVKDGVRL